MCRLPKHADLLYLLIIIEGTEYGRNELIAVENGY